jgi:hypothetical protein
VTRTLSPAPGGRDSRSSSSSAPPCRRRELGGQPELHEDLLEAQPFRARCQPADHAVELVERQVHDRPDVEQHRFQSDRAPRLRSTAPPRAGRPGRRRRTCSSCGRARMCPAGRGPPTGPARPTTRRAAGRRARCARRRGTGDVDRRRQPGQREIASRHIPSRSATIGCSPRSVRSSTGCGPVGMEREPAGPLVAPARGAPRRRRRSSGAGNHPQRLADLLRGPLGVVVGRLPRGDVEVRSTVLSAGAARRSGAGRPARWAARRRPAARGGVHGRASTTCSRPSVPVVAVSSGRPPRSTTRTSCRWRMR